MTDEIKKIPQIRFKGFVGEWKVIKLSEISDKVIEKNKDNAFSETLTNSAEFGIINQRDFFDKDISNEKNLNGYYVVQNDDFVYNPRISNFAPVGPIKRNKLGRTGVMSPLYYVFRTHDINKTYLEHYFDATGWHKFMKLNGDSGARLDRFAIKDSLLKEMPIPYPIIEEQTKIGSLFEQLDETIVLYQREYELLCKAKQSYLQKLFPKECEQIPEIRFTGFTEDWESRELNYYLETSRVKNNSEEYTKLDVLSVSGDLGIVNQIEFQGRSFAGVSVKPYGIVENRDVVYTKSPLKSNPYGIIKTNMGKSGIVSTLYAVYKPKENVDSKFIEFYFSNNLRLNKYLKPLVNKGAKNDMKVSDDNALKGLVKFPVMLEEQQKISSLFEQLNDMIALCKLELDRLNELKKKLLQMMFL